jgi:hypothetical protein
MRLSSMTRTFKEVSHLCGATVLRRRATIRLWLPAGSIPMPTRSTLRRSNTSSSDYQFVSTLKASIHVSLATCVSQGLGSRLPVWGSSGAAVCPQGSAPTSRLEAAPGPSHVPTAPALASWLGVAQRPPRVPVAPAPASWLRAAPGPPRVTWSPAPTFWLRTAPKLPRVPRMGSISCKQLNKYSLMTRP